MGGVQSQLHQQDHSFDATVASRDLSVKSTNLFGAARLSNTASVLTNNNTGSGKPVKMLLKLQPKSLDHGLTVVKSLTADKALPDSSQSAIASPAKGSKAGFRFSFKPSTPKADKSEQATPGSTLSIKSMRGKLAKKRKGTPNLSKIPTVSIDAARPLQVWVVFITGDSVMIVGSKPQAVCESN